MAANKTFSKDFPIDESIFTSAQVALGASTDANATEAILSNSRFPEGDIQVGHISLAADTGRVSLKPSVLPDGTSLSFDIASSTQSGLGVYTKFSDALSALNLTDPPALKVPDVSDRRYLLMDFGYSASFSGSGSNPVGVLGSATFGIDAKRESLYALVHGFNTNKGAHEVLAESIGNWMLPRQVAYVGSDLNISAETWLLVEVDGSLAIKLASSLGWNFNYAKDLTLLGVSHNLSTKIDASLSANFGFNVSGKYILVVGREGATPIVRLRLSKQSSKGLNFGFNLNVGIQGSDPQLPANFDGFIQSVFGVQGLQVLADLQQWTDPSNDLGQKIAGLADQTALDLLKNTTGIDPATEFDAAKQVVAGALDQWAALPDKLSSMLWKYIGETRSPGAAADFKRFLQDLASPSTGAKAVAAVLEKATFGDTAQGQFLESVADQGLLALADNLGPVTTAASRALNILNGGVIAKLQKFVEQKLDLNQIRKAVSDADFNKIDQWLKDRLGNFLDKSLDLDDLKEIQKAIQTLDAKAGDYYKTAVQALTKKYSADFAATYQKTTTDDALIDVNFDLSKPAAADMFAKVVERSDLDELFVKDVPGVTLNRATLSHDINRKGEVDFNMPLFDFGRTNVNDAMVTLTAEEQGGRVLLYQIHAKDTVTVANRAESQLSVLASLRIHPGQAPQLEAGGSISYEMRQVKAKMRPIDLEARTTAFIHEYLVGLFGGGDASIRSFYADLDHALTVATNSQSNFLGDVALSMQLSTPASVLGGWFQPRSASQLMADKMSLSRALQTAWKSLLPALYFQDLSRYQPSPSVAALLIWSAMPVATSIDLSGGTLTFQTDKDVFWNWPDVNLRRAVASNTLTVASLAAELTTIHAQLRESGSSNAAFFAPSRSGDFIRDALSVIGDDLLQSLLLTEATMVQSATDALQQIGVALSAAATAPTQAIKVLARFAAELTETFDRKVSSVYSGMSGQVVGPMLLAQASAAVGAAGVRPSAMLTLYALNPAHSFDLNTFISGSNPPKEDVALTQTLVSLS